MALKNLMAKGARPEERSPAIAPEVSARAHRTAAASTCIDTASELSGKLRSKESIRIDGRVKGEVHCEQTVIVGESASIQATIEADSVIISGEVKGDIAASRKITLQKNARVTGDLSTPGIVIEEGAKLEGRIVIGSDEKSADSKQQQPAARSAAKPSESAPAPASAPGVTPPVP